MFEHKGWWLPDGEGEIVRMMDLTDPEGGRGTYQFNKLRLALKQVTKWRTAVDIGGHVGLWSWHLAPRFRRVVAFEPTERHRECFVKNVTHDNVTLHACALGAAPGAVSMHLKDRNSGATHVDPGAKGDIPLRTLDSFGLQEVDFIKIDVEGFERFVLEGAQDTLKRCRPVLIVEAKARNARRFGLPDQAALAWLIEHGYFITGIISGDFILQPELS